MDPLHGTTAIDQGYGPGLSAAAGRGETGVTTAAAGAVVQTSQGIRLPGDRVTLSGQTAGGVKGRDDPQVTRQIDRLKSNEEKVKAHEAAHKAAGGSLTGEVSYSYTLGPDGRSYITGGEVQIDTSPGQTPQETVTKMQQVIRAALAPADPSAQDRSVAAQAASQMTQAQQEETRGGGALTSSPAAPGAGALQSRARQSYGAPSVQGPAAGDRGLRPPGISSYT